MRGHECDVYAYLYLVHDLRYTLRRAVRLPFVPRAGTTLEGEQTSNEASRVAWNYERDQFTIMCRGDYCLDEESLDEALKNHQEDGFSLVVDYGKGQVNA